VLRVVLGALRSMTCNGSNSVGGADIAAGLPTANLLQVSRCRRRWDMTKLLERGCRDLAAPQTASGWKPDDGVATAGLPSVDRFLPLDQFSTKA